MVTDLEGFCRAHPAAAKSYMAWRKQLLEDKRREYAAITRTKQQPIKVDRPSYDLYRQSCRQQRRSYLDYRAWCAEQWGRVVNQDETRWIASRMSEIATHLEIDRLASEAESLAKLYRDAGRYVKAERAESEARRLRAKLHPRPLHLAPVNHSFPSSNGPVSESIPHGYDQDGNLICSKYHLDGSGTGEFLG